MSKRRKDHPVIPVKPRKKQKITPTMRVRSARIIAICERTRAAQAKIDAFVKDVKMGELDELPVFVVIAKPVALPPPKPVPAPAKAVKVRAQKPVYRGKIKGYKCTFCQKAGHNRQSCAERKAFEMAMRIREEASTSQAA